MVVPPPALSLPPTALAPRSDDDHPYFLWWLDATVAELRQGLSDPDPKRRAYWMGALLREANTRDVWAFVSARQVRENWPLLRRRLGRTRPMWAWLLGLEGQDGPPRGGEGA